MTLKCPAKFWVFKNNLFNAFPGASMIKSIPPAASKVRSDFLSKHTDLARVSTLFRVPAFAVEKWIQKTF